MLVEANQLESRVVRVAKSAAFAGCLESKCVKGVSPQTEPDLQGAGSCLG